MRVTDLSIERNFLYNIFKVEKRLARLQDQASSGKAIIRPQDDPIGAGRSIYLRHDMAVSSQYQRNMDKAKNWMEQTESALSHLTNVIARARELALYGVTGTTPPDAKAAIAAEIRQLQAEAESIMNTTVDDRKLLTGTMPEWRVARDVMITTDDLGDWWGDMEATFVQLTEGLCPSDGSEPDEAAIQDALGRLDQWLDKILSARAENGARLRRLDILSEKAMNMDIEHQRLLSNVEEVDLVEVIVKLKSQEAAYQAALAAGARLIQPSLLDHLR
ncbi:MAG: hypothetical protein ACOX34_07050 [Bacillota bacterium]|nr:hypothetical protein [Candidatus Fermentithermobacillaceae bacterium]